MIFLTTASYASGIDAATKLMLHLNGDASGVVNTHNVSAYGTPAFPNPDQPANSDADFNNSLYFDGTDDYLSVPDSEDWDFGSDNFTIDFWYHGQGNSQGDRLFMQYLDASNYNYFYVTSGVNKQAYWDHNNITQLPSNAAIPDNSWVHFALVRNGDEFAMYVNGTKQSTTKTYAGAMTNIVAPVKLGIFHDSSYLSGYLDEFRISKGFARWTADFSGSLPSAPYSTDEYTKLLLHLDETYDDASGSLGQVHTYTVNGDPDYVPSKPADDNPSFGGSMYFDGTGDYLGLADSEDWNFGTGTFTIDCWIYIAGGSYHVLAGHIWGANSQHWGFGIDNSNKLVFNDGGSAGNEGGTSFRLTSSAAIPLSQWVHVAVSRDDSDNISLFINGVKDANTTVNDYDFALTGTYRIGVGNGATYYFQGYMDEFRISKGTARWTTTFTPPSSNYTTDSDTKLLLHFDDGDKSASQHTATIYGDPQVNPASSTGNFSGAMYFDGSGDYLSVADSTDWDFGSDDFTVDFWVNFSSLSSYQVLLSVNGTDYGPNIGYSNSGNTLIAWILGGNNSFSWTAATDTWYHVCLVRYGTNLKAFVNGEQIGSTISNSSDITGGSSGIEAAAYSGGNNLTGYLDEVRVSKGVARWTSDFTPPDSPYSEINTKLLLHLDGDESSQQHTVNVYGNPQYASLHPATNNASFGGSMYFDGTGDYLTIPDSDDWHFGTGDFTIDFWFNFDSIQDPGTAYPHFWSLGDSSTNL
ncbi:LamG domain-containing protein, partial [Candidatus Margulisiibacteriota bacterium]